VPRGKAIWNANGGFVSVLLTHLFCILFVFCFLTAAYFKMLNALSVWNPHKEYLVYEWLAQGRHIVVV